MSRSAKIAARHPHRRWVVVVPFLALILIPFSMLAHDLRATFGAAALMFAIDAVAVRLNRASKIVQIALWVGSAAFATAAWFYGSSLQR